MKNFLSVILLLVTIFVSNNFANAQDIFCYSEKNLSYYLASDKISVVEKEPIFRCLVNVIDNKTKKLVNFHSFGFENRDGVMVCYVFWRSRGIWEYQGAVRDNALNNAVWQNMKPYLKQRGFENIYYWD